ncbi:hypothetical protein [Spartinivicinus ruber]|uniref:hypothetical protein n=1 Tax=Spartinivicinus ruber TaxID=2683272 RepID=UPI0013D68868|nr:hypothetical protein [Spartinivicinus ruber]
MLSVPKQQIIRNTVINCTPQAVKQELKDLPLDDMPQTLRQTCALLSLINRTQVNDNKRLGIMQCFDYAFRNLDENYHLRNPQALINSTTTEKNKLAELKQEMAYGYKTILLEAIAQNDLTHKPIAEIIYMAMYYLGHSIMQCYDTYTLPDDNLWYEINQLYSFAERYQIHRVTLGRAFSLPAANTIEDYFKQILLVELANPYQLSSGESWQVYSYLGHWVKHVKLLHEPESLNYLDYFLLDLDSRRCPHQIFAPPQPDQHSYRYLCPNRLIALTEQHINTLKGGHRPAEIGIPNSNNNNRAIELLTAIERQWQHMKHRQDTRVPCNLFTSIAWGVDTIHEMLAPIETVNSQNNSYHRATGKMVNESQGGYCLKINQALMKEFYNGQIIAMRSDKQAHPRWLLGFVRWQQQLPSAGSSLVGIQYLKGHVRPVTLQPLQKSFTKNPLTGLMLTNKENTGKQQHSLLTSAGTLGLGKGLELIVPQKTKAFEILTDHLLNHTPLVEQYSFRAFAA